MDENAKKDGFGSKQIGFFAGVALLFNNITGPAMIDIPVLYQQAGWVTPTLAMIFILLVSTIASSMLVEVMASIPNNDRFQGRVELTTLAYHYFPAWGYWLTQIFLNFSLQALNISSIIVSAQMMDFTLVSLFNFLCAFEFFPHFGYVSVSELGNDTSPFTGVVISLGFLIVLIVTVPLGYFNLDDNMIVQQGAFLLAFAIVIQWIVEFFFIGFDSALVPAFGPDQSQVLGTTIFNYAFVITVPSWINETSGSVSINKALWVGSILSTVVYVVLGVLGGFSLPFSGDQNLLDALTENTSGALNTASLVSVYSFPAIVLLSSIPIYSIIVRYNLLESEFCSKGWANFWGVLFPWMVAVPFCTGSGFNIFVNWSSLLVSGVINFVVPLILYIVMKREQMSGTFSKKKNAINSSP
eukprot:TRINITY_DN1594_c0_g2_i1.p1 TRINITY_DN1594_c0_g2~~TRINITY_DN1594_c0_g2_i1.p1  ORF type:complete len:412 (-),score=121.43 TRINITY_DN1594_c0_g2_i1:1068-2303(-)